MGTARAGSAWFNGELTDPSELNMTSGAWAASGSARALPYRAVRRVAVRPVAGDLRVESDGPRWAV